MMYGSLLELGRRAKHALGVRASRHQGAQGGGAPRDLLFSPGIGDSERSRLRGVRGVQPPGIRHPWLEGPAAVALLRGLAAVIPRGAGLALGRWVGTLAYALFPRARRVLRTPSAFANFARSRFDALYVATMGPARRAALLRRVVGAEHLAGGAAIVVSAHVGNFEMGASVLAALAGPSWAFTAPADSALRRFLVRARQRLGVAALPSLRDLGEARPVAWLVDAERDARRAVALARRTGRRIVPMFVWAEPDGRYVAEVGPPVALDSQALAERLGRAVARSRDQWFPFLAAAG